MGFGTESRIFLVFKRVSWTYTGQQVKETKDDGHGRIYCLVRDTRKSKSYLFRMDG